MVCISAIRKPNCSECCPLRPPPAIQPSSRHFERCLRNDVRNIFLPALLNLRKIRTTEVLPEDDVRCIFDKKFSREFPQAIKRRLHAAMAFVRSITEPQQPLKCISPVIADFFPVPAPQFQQGEDRYNWQAP